MPARDIVDDCFKTMTEQTPNGQDTKGKDRHGGLLDRGDLIVSAILLIFCGYFYYLTTTFEEPSALLGENVGPADFPRLILTIIAILAVLMLLERRLQPARWQKIKDGQKDPVGTLTWRSIVFVLVVTAAAPYLGAILTMFLVCLFLPLLWGERRLWMVLPFALLFTCTVTWVFNVVLRVFFEPGIFNLSAKSIALVFGL